MFFVATNDCGNHTSLTLCFGVAATCIIISVTAVITHVLSWTVAGG